MLNLLPLILTMSVFFLFKISKGVSGKFLILYFLGGGGVFAIYIITLQISGLSAFSYGDATYFHEGGENVYHSISSGSNLRDALFLYTWEPKYWGYIYLNYLSYDLYPHSILLQSITLKLFNFLIWSIFILHAIKNVKGFDAPKNMMLISLVLASFFPVLLNYRDIIVSVSFYFFCYGVFLNRSYIVISLCVIVMFFFRREMVPLMFVSVIFSYSVYYVYIKLFKFSFFIYSLVCFLICLLLVFLIGHDRFSLDSLIKIPLSLIGTSPLQLLALYFDGESYYQGRFVNHIAHVIFSFSWIYLCYSYLKLLLRNSVNKFENIPLVFFAIFVFIFNLVAYTLINDGFQERVKVSVISLFVFMYVPYSKLSVPALIITISLFFLVTLRNLRWVF